MKRCFKCWQEKELDAFYKHSGMSGGRFGKCKECTKKDTRQNRIDRIEHYRMYDRMRASKPHRVALSKRVQAEWRLRHPERRKAQVALSNAVRDGRVIPWPVCAVSDCGGKPEAHHPDYSRPLDVVWLCSIHHKQVHAMANRLLKAA